MEHAFNKFGYFLPWNDHKISDSIQLETNPDVDVVVDHLKVAPLDRERILFEYKNRNKVTETSSSNFITGRLAEVHLKLQLEEMKLHGVPINTEPIYAGQKTKKFIFERTKLGDLRVVRKKTKGSDTVVEYDALAVIAGLPVVFESKFVRRAQKQPSATSTDLTHAISTERIQQVFTPLQEIYDNRFGYVVMTTNEALNQKYSEFDEFAGKGGILATYPFVRDEVIQMADELKLESNQ